MSNLWRARARLAFCLIVLAKVLGQPCLAQPAPQLSSMDMRKSVIEFPVEKMLKTKMAPPPRSADSAMSEPAVVPSTVNRKVAPGLVRWHKDFASACAQSKLTGKPVLLLHIMGNLDDEFC